MLDAQLTRSEEPNGIEPEVALMIALQALEAALHSLNQGQTLDAKDAIWQALAVIKRK